MALSKRGLGGCRALAQVGTRRELPMLRGCVDRR